MSICIGVDVNGFLYQTVEVFPACSEFVGLDPSYMERLTYFADLSIALDPSKPELYLLMTATLTLFVIVAGWRLLIRQVFNR